MTEKTLWDDLQRDLGPFGVLVRVENRVSTGTPDLAFLLRRYPKVSPVSGWLEMKWIEKCQRGPIKIKSLTIEQIQWQEAWAKAGGRVGTLLRVEYPREHMLLDPYALRRIFSETVRGAAGLRALAAFSEPGPVPVPRLIKWLTDQ
jgi:hypothetical protein